MKGHNWPQKHNTATKGMEICLKWDAKWFKTKWQQKGLKKGKRKMTNSDYNKMQAKTQRKEKYVCTNWLIWILQTQNQLLTWAIKPSQRPLSLKVSSRSHSGPHKMTMKEKKKKRIAGKEEVMKVNVKLTWGFRFIDRDTRVESVFSPYSSSCTQTHRRKNTQTHTPLQTISSIN